MSSTGCECGSLHTSKKIAQGTDIEYRCTFKDENGQAIPIPVFDFDFEFFTQEDGHSVLFGQRGRQLYGECDVIDDVLYAYIDTTPLGRGMVKVRKTLHVPNSKFPDHVQDQTIVQTLNYMVI